MKKIIIIIAVILSLIIIGGISFYFWGIGPKSQNTENQIFTIEPGTSKTLIAKNLAKEGLIRSEFALDAFLFFHKYTIQAGDYELNKAMSVKEMLDKFAKGDVKINSSKITIIPGERLIDFAKTLSDNLEFGQQEFLNTISDKEFLATLIEKYWFLTSDILNDEIYYPLEGYILPDTYEFLNNLSPKEVVTSLLDNTSLTLEPLKEQITNNSYTIHELLTMASILEKEANTLDERKTASQVFYTRLNENWSLGSDVTAFYGAKKEMGKDSETWDVLNNDNPYNTRLTNGKMNGKLPIGPICSPSLISIQAAIEPSNTNYYYFVANTCTGELTFLTTATEFYAKTNELRTAGCI